MADSASKPRTHQRLLIRGLCTAGVVLVGCLLALFLYDQWKIDRIQKGMTEEEVRQVLGEPWIITKNEFGLRDNQIEKDFRVRNPMAGTIMAIKFEDGRVIEINKSTLYIWQRIWYGWLGRPGLHT